MITIKVIVVGHTATIPLIPAHIRPRIDQTNVTPSHWQGNGLRKVRHFHIHSNSETLVLQKRKTSISPAGDAFNDVTCILFEYSMPGKKKETIMCDLDLWNEVCYHRFESFNALEF